MHAQRGAEVWLAGGTGLIGGHAIGCLTEAAGVAAVQALARQPRPATGKLRWHGWDWLAHPDAGCDIAICCLGTTRRRAGSKAAFTAVDHDLVLAFARAARAAGASRFGLVSSVGASPRAASLYLRTKGQVEQDLQALNFQALHILRPSLLLGRRDESRPAEDLAQRLAPAVSPLLRGALARYRPISAAEVARLLCRLTLFGDDGVHIHHPWQLRA